MTAPLNTRREPPYKLAGLVLTLLTIGVVVAAYALFRGDNLDREQLTMISSRAGLSMDPGAKVTYNGVEIGRVGKVQAVTVGDQPRAKIVLDVDPKYFKYIPQNVIADITATTVFGNKYISFTSPKDPTPQRITTKDVIDVTSVTTEFNTLFETVVDVAQQVDPVEARTRPCPQPRKRSTGSVTGSASRSSTATRSWPTINPQMPQIRHDNQRLADLGDVYANAAPDLFDGLEHAVTTARTLNEQQGNIDQALMAAVGFGNTGGDIFERGGPYLVRGTADLVPTVATARHLQPRTVLHDPQLPRRRAQGRRIAWRQRVFAADASPNSSDWEPVIHTCTPTTCRG